MRVVGRGPSARALRSALRDTRGLVNWTGAPLEGAINARTETNKLNQLERLRNADVPVVEFATENPGGWLARSSYHQRGLDFSQNGTIRERADFWTKPEPSSSEYRVHVFRLPGGRTGDPAGFQAVRIGWKTSLDDSAGQHTVVPIRSRQFGWRLSYYARPENCAHGDLKLVSRWAIAVLGWDFGAVDVLRTRRGFVVLEANSCPGLRDQYTLDTYVHGIRALRRTDGSC